MESPPATPRFTTIAEYLERERHSEEKHEYRDGQIVLMTGRTADHSLISANIVGELGNRLEGTPCRVYESSLRIRVPSTVLYTYPDASVICGPPERDPNDPSGGTVTNPRLIVEVLSATTEAYDRGKFHRYLQLDSLQEYVLVSQAAARIETFWRQAEGTWLFTAFSGLSATAKLRSLDIDLPLREIYAGVEMPAA